MEALPWFRLYGEFATDPVVQSLSFDDQRHFVMILCLKSTGLLDREFGHPQARTDVIRKVLGLDGKAWDEMRHRLSVVGLIDGDLQPKAWEKRQMLSDTSRERTRAYRERMKRSCDVTVTAQDTDKDTDTEKEEKKDGANAPFGVSEQVWKDFKKLRRTLKAPITDTALTGISREAAKAGMTLDAALTMCIERNWRGFKAEWVEKPRGTDDNPWHKTASGIKAKGAEYGLFPSAFLFNGDPERQDWQAFKNAVLAKAGVPA